MDENGLNVLLIPSGASTWEEAGRVQGGADLPLGPASVAELGGMFKGIEKTGIDRVWSGPDEASRQTAARLAQALGLDVRISEDLRGQGLGLWEGECEHELAERCSRFFRQWKSDPASVVAPEGEPWDRFSARVWGELVKQARRRSRGKVVALVARPDVCRALAAMAQDLGVTLGKIPVEGSDPVDNLLLNRSNLLAHGRQATIVTAR